MTTSRGAAARAADDGVAGTLGAFLGAANEIVCDDAGGDADEDAGGGEGGAMDEIPAVDESFILQMNPETRQQRQSERYSISMASPNEKNR